jgi:hypothetical protein
LILLLDEMLLQLVSQLLNLFLLLWIFLDLSLLSQQLLHLRELDLVLLDFSVQLHYLNF